MKRRSAATSSSAYEPLKDSTELSPKRSESLSTFLSAFMSPLLTYIFLCVIFVNCSSVNEEQISQGDILVTQGSSPLPASLQVGQ